MVDFSKFLTPTNKAERKPYPKRIQLRNKLMEIMAGYDNEHAATLIAEFIANNYRRRRKG